jgi:hypothetical protein
MFASFPKVYNGYYDDKNPIHFDFNAINRPEHKISFEELFSDQKVELVYTSIALQDDIEMLKQIASKTLSVKTFDYDGVKFTSKESLGLASKLTLELNHLNEQIKNNDISIFDFFRDQEQAQNKPSALEDLYREFFEFDKNFEAKYDIYIRLSNALQFLNFNTPSEQIIDNFKEIAPLEIKLKKEIKEMLSECKYQAEITKEIRDNFELYLTKKWNYYSNDTYIESSLEIMFTALNNYRFLLSRIHVFLKRNLLNYQENLIEKAGTTTPMR